jgi:peptide/nickel transport system substrate-binding protein
VGIAQPAGATTAEAEVSQVAARLRYAALVTMGEDGAVQPALASRWEASEDGLTWRLFLRPGLTFDDGSPLDAAAVAAVLEGARAVSRSLPGLRDVTAVRAENPTVLTIEQRAPSALLFEALSQQWIVGGPDGTATAGAYRLVSQDPALAVLEAFDGYYRGRPQIDRVELHGYASPRAAWVALMRAEIDFLYEVPVDAIEFVEASTDVQTFPFLRSYVHLLGFNLAHPPLADARVRRALDLAIDREAVVTHAFGGRAQAARGGVWPRHWTLGGTEGPPPPNPTGARALLEEALGRAAAESGAARVRLSCLLPAGYPAFERSGLVIQKQLLDIGVDLELQVVPVSELAERLAAGRFETYLFEQATGLGLNWSYWFWHSPGDSVPWIRSGYTAADAALDRVRYARDQHAFRAAVGEFQRVLIDDPPAVFLAWSETSRALRRRFVIPSEADRDVFALLPQWHLPPPGGTE